MSWVKSVLVACSIVEGSMNSCQLEKKPSKINNKINVHIQIIT